MAGFCAARFYEQILVLSVLVSFERIWIFKTKQVF